MFHIANVIGSLVEVLVHGAETEIQGSFGPDWDIYEVQFL